MKETETGPTTPEHLIKMLDLQMVMQRERRSRSGRNRVLFVVGALLFIVVGAGVALFVLMQMLSELRPLKRPTEARSTVQTGPENF